MRAKRGSATVPLSGALRGMKPQQTVEKTIASKSDEYAASKGQLMKTDFEESSASSPSPKCGRRRGSELNVSNQRRAALGEKARLRSAIDLGSGEYSPLGIAGPSARNHRRNAV